MSTLLERLHHMPVCWEDALRERREAADMLIALQIEIALLHATINASRREREGLLLRLAQALDIAQRRRVKRAMQ